VQLIEGWSSHLPVTFLVQISKRHRIRKQLVQLVGNLHAHWLFEIKRQRVIDSSVRLDFASALMKAWLGAHISVCLRLVPFL
jgi:hypothetical protein